EWSGGDGRFNPNSEIERERDRPGRCFPRPRGKPWVYGKVPGSRFAHVVRSAEREARSATPGAGMLPELRNSGLK
ncbi:MAG: hypothetical protein ABIP71_07425, partial [Verrucomicrobiota bacterium]